MQQEVMEKVRTELALTIGGLHLQVVELRAIVAAHEAEIARLREVQHD